MSSVSHCLSVALSTTHAPKGQPCYKGSSFSRRHGCLIVWLVQPTDQLGKQLIARNTRRRAKPRLLLKPTHVYTQSISTAPKIVKTPRMPTLMARRMRAARALPTINAGAQGPSGGAAGGVACPGPCSTATRRSIGRCRLSCRSATCGVRVTCMRPV